MISRPVCTSCLSPLPLLVVVTGSAYPVRTWLRMCFLHYWRAAHFGNLLLLISTLCCCRPCCGDCGAVYSLIVVFKSGSGSAVAAAAALSTHVRSKLAAAGDVQAASLSSLQVLHTLGDYTAPLPPTSLVTHPEAAAVAAAAVADRLSDATAAPQSVTTGVQGVVMRIQHPAALAAVRAASNVQAVVPDRPIAAQQEPNINATCILPQQLSMGVAPSFVPRGFIWRGCRTATTGEDI